MTTSPVSEVYNHQTQATCTQSTSTCQLENARHLLTAAAGTQPLVLIQKPPVFCLIRTRFYSGASSFWIPTRQDKSLTAFTPHVTINPSSRLVQLSNTPFSSLTSTCQRLRNTCLARWMHCGVTSSTQYGTLISPCIVRPPTRRPS